MLESLVSLIAATGLLLGSPGPAPLALAATGATFGIRRGAPFLAGILLGLSVAIIGASIGLAALFSRFPDLRLTCQLLGAAYIAFIAYKIASAPCTQLDDAQQEPSFKDGFILNLLNPKAYAAFLAIFSQFLLPLENTALGYLATGICALLVATLVDSLWLIFGGLLRPLFSRPKAARALRIFFAVAMLVAVGYALLA
ncbi:LysE family translocator [Shewanella alkalitolerans]|uniref:LysE family translocator n=1 Tax=Shewanella alkalitolerans TaxID=2864209 RepID=UPI001C65B3ED|nr:LysE family translocator [Shewanella alkalitolerans]QYJ98448.1 LysE family translocator [Shewanella alkalitolerans]